MAERDNAASAGAAVGCEGREPVRESSGKAGTDEAAVDGAVVVSDAGVVPGVGKLKMLTGGTNALAADGTFSALCRGVWVGV